MGRYIMIIVLFLLVLVLIFNNSSKDIRKVQEERGVFISYIELSKYLKYGDIRTSKENINKMIKSINEMKFNTIYLQVRSNADSIYNSDIFPCSKYICNDSKVFDFDVLDYFIKKASKYKISIYAWINPYRVRGTNDIDSIDINSPAYKYKGSDTLYVSDGIYFNPAKDEVIDLIVDGVLEVVKNYNIKGVIFDDYFYPDDLIDLNDYKSYIKKNKYIDIKDYRLNNVNKMIKKVYNTCHKYNKLFGVSPDGNTLNNYNKNYADIYTWGKDNGYVDLLIPQLYYGFNNETKHFYEVAKEWDKIVSNDSINLVIALAFYKVGLSDKYAKSGSDEWIINNDIIKREIIVSRNLKHYSGFALFRYDYLFSDEMKTDAIMSEIKNMQDVLD